MIHFIQMTQLVRPGSPSIISAILPKSMDYNLVMELVFYYSHRYHQHWRWEVYYTRQWDIEGWNLERGILLEFCPLQFNMTCACFSPFHLVLFQLKPISSHTLLKKVFLNRCSKTFLYSFYSLFIDPHFTFLTSAQTVHLIQGAADVQGKGFARINSNNI